MSVTCSHLDQIEVWSVPGRNDVAGCEECLRLGMRWVHLRICRTCGHIGCCDSSPGKHASEHANGTEHAIMTSIEPVRTGPGASSTRWHSSSVPGEALRI